MKLVVFSIKKCWAAESSLSGYVTDGGFPFQMDAISQLFDSTRLVVLAHAGEPGPGKIPLTGHRISVHRLPLLGGADWSRKLRLPFWLLRTFPRIWTEIRDADAVHTPIPGDLGTIAMIVALLQRKPLFVRHCGNWLAPETAADHFWKWCMERWAGGRNVMFATGQTDAPPSQNPNVRWIFATSLTKAELQSYARVRPAPAAKNPRLIIVGRAERDKGAGTILQSLPRLVHRFPGLALDVVGSGTALPHFRAEAEQLAIASHVRFHGNVDHATVIRLLQGADVFCFPTTSSEGFPKAVLEGLACGLPVITTRVSALPKLIGRGCGVLLDASSPEAIEAAVTRVLGNPAEYAAMSRRAVETAAEYSLERWRDTIGAALQAAWGPLQSRDQAVGQSAPVSA